MTEKRFKLRVHPKDKGVKIFDDGADDGYRRLFDVHYVDYESAKLLRARLEPMVELLNELSDENEQLKQQKDKWKQQCIHFKEMLDDMDIAFLCDEWIYEELKGDV